MPVPPYRPERNGAGHVKRSTLFSRRIRPIWRFRGLTGVLDTWPRGDVRTSHHRALWTCGDSRVRRDHEQFVASTLDPMAIAGRRARGHLVGRVGATTQGELPSGRGSALVLRGSTNRDEKRPAGCLPNEPSRRHPSAQSRQEKERPRCARATARCGNLDVGSTPWHRPQPTHARGRPRERE